MTVTETLTCTECSEHEARHTVRQRGQERRLCCFCNYAESGVASDWHPECMQALAEYRTKHDHDTKGEPK